MIFLTTRKLRVKSETHPGYPFWYFLQLYLLSRALTEFLFYFIIILTVSFPELLVECGRVYVKYVAGKKIPEMKKTWFFKAKGPVSARQQ